MLILLSIAYYKLVPPGLSPHHRLPGGRITTLAISPTDDRRDGQCGKYKSQYAQYGVPAERSRRVDLLAGITNPPLRPDREVNECLLLE